MLRCARTEIHLVVYTRMSLFLAGPEYQSMPPDRENTISPLMLKFTSNRFQNDRSGLLIEENEFLHA